jgi:hypothetical protein
VETSSTRQDPPTLLQNTFLVSVDNPFLVSAILTDTIYTIRKMNDFWYRLFPADTQNRFSKKKNWSPDRALLTDAHRGRRCCRISSGLRRAVGESQPSRSWSSGASSAMGAVGAPRLPRAVGPHRLDRRVLLATAEHHLCLTSDWSRHCCPLETGTRILRHGLPDLDVLRELEERAVVSVPWHAAPCTVDEDGDEWWDRERGRRPSRGELT